MAREILSLVLATHNAGKAREIADLLGPYISTFYTAGELGLPEPEETESTFAGNARLKALAAAKASGKPALADDSGLSVTALGGDPGIYSARWAQKPDGTRDFSYAMNKVEEALGTAEDRSAAFVCALCLAWPDGHVEIFEGRAEGHLEFPPRGTHGFGYDPIFVPQGQTITFAQMEPDQKHAMSHRADAFRQLVAATFEDEAV
ncbi:MAG TPA: RdgB/HAM1 family non-canonical purine NTP pyrophosphatase [Alphaproteobacteria bacterium]|nr:RdgB/HAM1 family non-canonical purine NTP pyrophosphatase [Alphaproteobacteria bacterium]